MVKNLPAVKETWVQPLGWEYPLQKGTATHSSIVGWRIPWTEEPRRLHSTGLQRPFTRLLISVYMHAQSLYSCLNLCDSMDCSPPSSAVHGILQATILEWVAMSSSRGSSQSKNRSHPSLSPALEADSFTTEPSLSATAFSSELMGQGSYYRSYTLNSKSVWRMQSNSVTCFFLLLAPG